MIDGIERGKLVIFLSIKSIFETIQLNSEGLFLVLKNCLIRYILNLFGIVLISRAVTMKP